MGQFLDLRKYNIKTEEDAIEFLELFVNKAPQLVTLMKNQKMKNISLKNRLNFAQLQKARPAEPQVTDPDASVLDRMQGNHKATQPTAEQSRLNQLKAAQSKAAEPTTSQAKAPITKEMAKRVLGDDVGDSDPLPPAPVAPGEIGQLNVPTVNGHAPVEDDLAARGAVDEGQQPAGVTEEEAAQAAGSKSERPADDGVQSQDTPAEVPVEEDQPVSSPSDADKTSIGTHIAKKTEKKAGKK